MNRLYRYWLSFLRYANIIDLHGATASGNLNEVAWCRLRISQIDNEIDILRVQTWKQRMQ